MRGSGWRAAVGGLAVTTLAACGWGEPVHVPGTAAPVGARTPAVNGTPPPSARKGSPVSREVGGPLWSLALVVSDQSADDPKLRAAVETVAPYDTAATVLSVECDPGIRPGLNLRPQKRYWYAALYFETQDAAFGFKESRKLKVAGVVSVQPVKGCR